MFSEIITRRVRPPRDKNSLENLQYVRYIICSAMPITPKNQSEVRTNIELFTTLLHRGTVSQLENIESIIQQDKLGFLATVYYKACSFFEVQTQVVASYAYLLQNLTNNMLDLLIQSEPMQAVLISALSSTNPDIRGYAAASLKFLASSITVRQLQLLRINDGYPFLINIVNCYIISERDQRMAIKGLILATLQHSQHSTDYQPTLFEWVCQVILGPFVSYLCFELLTVSTELGRLSDGPNCPLHDSTKRARVKELHEKTSDILDFLLDLSTIGSERANKEHHGTMDWEENGFGISHIIIQRLIELIIGPVILVSLQRCHFGKLPSNNIEWPIHNFSIYTCIHYNSQPLTHDADVKEQQRTDPLAFDYMNSGSYFGSVNSQTQEYNPMSNMILVLDQNYTELLSGSMSAEIDGGENHMKTPPLVLPVHTTLILLLHIMMTFKDSIIGEYLYNIFFSSQNSTEYLRKVIGCPIVTGTLLTIALCFKGLGNNAIIPNMINAKQQDSCHGFATVREWCEYFVRTHDSTKEPILIRLIAQVVQKYMAVLLSCSNDILDLILIRFFLIFQKYSKSCKISPSSAFIEMCGLDFVNGMIESVYKKHLRYVTLKQLRNLVEAYKEIINTAQLRKNIDRQLETLTALSVQEEESSELYLTKCCEPHSNEWRLLFLDKNSGVHNPRQALSLTYLYTVLSLYNDEILPYRLLADLFKDFLKNLPHC